MKARKQSPSLPAAVTAYWAAANAGQAEAAARCFAPDAVVRDEGREHRGPAEIAAWVAETTRQYHPQAEPLRAQAAGDRLTVTARVSGDFPGSPVELDFIFTLRAGRIAALEIS